MRSKNKSPISSKKWTICAKNIRTNQQQIKDAETKAKDADEFENLSRRDVELTQELARLRAKLESDEKFQSEIKNGLCPILSEKCLNLKPGQTLENFVSGQFTEVKTQISVFENEQKTLIARAKNFPRSRKVLSATRNAEIARKMKSATKAKATKRKKNNSKNNSKICRN